MSPLAFARLCVVAIVVPLAACAGPPWPVSQSADAIALRWYTGDVSNARVDQIAELHCAGAGRRAVLASDERDGSVEVADYTCR